MPTLVSMNHKWVLIDNYDSFTYILHDYLAQVGAQCAVYRNNEISLLQLQELSPTAIVISPGPETPIQAGITMEVIRYFHNKIPIIGICLGHQALGMFFGAELYRLAYPMHGKISSVQHTGNNIAFKNVPQSFDVMRYHSLAIKNLEDTGLRTTATTADACIMAIEHELYPCLGLQFHPESVGTPMGLQMLKNMVSYAEAYSR